MDIRATLTTAITALRANLGRSLLTILGIIIGVLAIVLVMSLGEGAQHVILSEFEGIGANTVIVRPGRQPTGPTDIAETLLSDSLKERDIVAMRRQQNVPDARLVAPAVLVPGGVSYQDNVFRPTILGWTPAGLKEMVDIEVVDGEMFSEADIRGRAKVAVLGSRVKEELFGESYAIGEFVTVRNTKLRVVGVLPARGQGSFFNVDEIVLLPYTTAQRTILGIDYYHEVFVKAASDEVVNEVADDIRATLRETHDISDPDKDDFFVTTQQEAVETIGTVTTTLTVFLAAIASIALVVGGIGIMNIMLVSVTERTQEIGLRKAVGATNQDILWQFLAEAVLLTGLGGVIGTALALIISFAVATVIRQQLSINWTFQLPLGAVALGVGVAVGIGLVFGIFPARKAAQKDPIKALKYE